jgi:hypothetical protein
MKTNSKLIGAAALISLLASTAAWAGVATGEGYGPNRADAAEKAKNAAIARTGIHKVMSVTVDACDQGSNSWWTCTATAIYED